MSEPTALWYNIHSTDDIPRLEQKVECMDRRLHDCETRITELQTENLRLVNRILEAEVAIERYKNLMLRKNISFPFSPMLSHKFHL